MSSNMNLISCIILQQGSLAHVSQEELVIGRIFPVTTKEV